MNLPDSLGGFQAQTIWFNLLETVGASPCLPGDDQSLRRSRRPMRVSVPGPSAAPAGAAEPPRPVPLDVRVS